MLSGRSLTDAAGPPLRELTQDIDADHVASPRVIKSHEAWEHVAKGGKYIYVARNPEDAFYSFYKFLPAYTGLDPEDIDEQTFADAIFAGASHSGQIWGHMLGWWQQRHNKNVLWVFFEDLKKDLQQEVRRVARFMGTDMHDDERLQQAITRSGFAYMSQSENAHHFDDHFVRAPHRLRPLAPILSHPLPSSPILTADPRPDFYPSRRNGTCASHHAGHTHGTCMHTHSCTCMQMCASACATNVRASM
jgi:hypothetical protein